jgi:hypothetical protein
MAHTLAVLFRSSGEKQLENMVLSQVLLYIKVLESEGELSKKIRARPVATKKDLDIILGIVFSDAYSLRVRNIRRILNPAVYINLFVNACGRGSDLAWGGSNVAKEDNHCLRWDHCRFYTAQVGDGDRVICANIDIKYQKGQRDKDLKKAITLRLLPAAIATQDSLRLLITLALVDGVFGPGITWDDLLAVEPGEFRSIHLT